jgi:hypothetical protein
MHASLQGSNCSQVFQHGGWNGHGGAADENNCRHEQKQHSKKDEGRLSDHNAEYSGYENTDADDQANQEKKQENAKNFPADPGE